MLHGIAVFQRKQEDFMVQGFEVAKVIELGRDDFHHFWNNLLEDQEFIKRDKHLLNHAANGVLLVLGEGYEDGVLVDPQGYDYARYSALLPHARSILAQQSMSPALKELNNKLQGVVRSTEYIVRRQLEQSDEVTLSIADIGSRYGVELEGNNILVDTVSAMLREELEDLSLQMEINRGEFVFTPMPRLAQDIQPTM